MAKKLTIIIPTRNRVAILEESLHHLYKSINPHDVGVIVVNDGDDTVYKIKSLYPGITIINNPKNGVASARNAGAKIATADLLLFLDDDIWITPDAIDRVLQFHKQYDNATLNLNWIYPPSLQKTLTQTSFGRYLDKNHFTSLKGWNRDAPVWQDDYCFKTSGITSQNLSLRKKIFDDLGGYNEKFPHAGFEDHDFYKKITSKGIDMYIDPTVMTFHNEADRLELNAWMDRRRRGAATRYVAVSLGYEELTLKFSRTKKILFNIITLLRPLLIVLSCNKIVDRAKLFDIFSFSIFNALFATTIYQGYTKKSQERH